jgi:cytochrome c oxidase subunit 2
MSQRSQTVEIAALILLFLGITAFTVIGFLSRSWLPIAASEHATGVDAVLRYLWVTTGFLLILGTLAMAVFLWRYGRGRQTPSPQVSPKTARWVALVPVFGMALIAEAGVMLKGLPVWDEVYGEVPEDAVIVELTGKQFEWIVRYAGPDGTFGRTEAALVDDSSNPAGLDESDPAGRDDLVYRGRLRVPVGRTVHARLRGRDVLHSFSVPAFRVKQDVVPGIVIGTTFTPTQEGEFEIACAQLCGMGHYRMGGTVVVLSPEEYESWLSEQVGWLE